MLPPRCSPNSAQRAPCSGSGQNRDAAEEGVEKVKEGVSKVKETVQKPPARRMTMSDHYPVAQTRCNTRKQSRTRFHLFQCLPIWLLRVGHWWFCRCAALYASNRKNQSREALIIPATALSSVLPQRLPRCRHHGCWSGFPCSADRGCCAGSDVWVGTAVLRA